MSKTRSRSAYIYTPLRTVPSRAAPASYHDGDDFDVERASKHEVGTDNRGKRSRPRRPLYATLFCLFLFLIPVFSLLCYTVPGIPYWIGFTDRYQPRSPLPTSASSSSQATSSSSSSSLIPPAPRYQTTQDEERAYQFITSSASNWTEYQQQLSTFLGTAFEHSPHLSDLQHILQSTYFTSPATASSDSPRPEPIPPSIWQTAKHSSDFEHASSRSFLTVNSAAAAGSSSEVWTEHLFADPRPSEWANATFGQSSPSSSFLTNAWQAIDRGVMRADVWRYAVLAFEGGLYSDLDTTCLKPFRQWTAPSSNLSTTGNADEKSLLHVDEWDVGAPLHLRTAPPQLVVGIEADALGVRGWSTFWPRPIQIVQWTLAGSRAHPVLLDVLRRIHGTMSQVAFYREQNRLEAERLRARAEVLLSSSSSSANDGGVMVDVPLGSSGPQKRQSWWMRLWDRWWPFHFHRAAALSMLREAARLEALDPFASSRHHPHRRPPSPSVATASPDSEARDPSPAYFSVVEATGPGVWTDAVLAYLQTRYHVHWSQLHDLRHVTRIGEVVILPLTGLSPTDDEWGRRQRWERIGIRRGPMARVGGWGNVGADVHHAFAGSWRTRVDTNA
ncbi:hypothetical protein V8E36_006518 [Tilletia maclaganii]